MKFKLITAGIVLAVLLVLYAVFGGSGSAEQAEGGEETVLAE